MLKLVSLICLFVFTNLHASSGKIQTLASPFAPSDGKNGYVGEMKFTYKFQKCDKESFVGITSFKKVSPTKYRYKGKLYSPQDLGMNDFGEYKLIAVSSLAASVYNGSYKVGDMKMGNVTDFGGIGCVGQIYSIKDQITGYDESTPIEKLREFQLRNPNALVASSDTKLETLISSQERAGEKEGKEKKQAEAKAKADQAESTQVNKTEKKEVKPTEKAVAVSQIPKNEPVKSPTKQSQKTTKTVVKREQPKDAQKTLESIDKNVQRSVKQSAAQGKNLSQAAGTLGTAASGMWEDGMGIGFGLATQDEDNALFYSITFGSWDFPLKWDTPGKFFTGAYSYFFFEGDEALRPEPGDTLGAGEDKFTTAMLGINFLNDSLGWHILRPVWGVSINFVDEYDENGNAEDGLGTEFGFDYGLAFVLPGLAVSYTKNTAAESEAFHFIFQN